MLVVARVSHKSESLRKDPRFTRYNRYGERALPSSESRLYWLAKPVGLRYEARFELRYRGHCRGSYDQSRARAYERGQRLALLACWSPALRNPRLLSEFEDPNLAERGGQGRARAVPSEQQPSARVGRSRCRLRHTTKIFLVMERVNLSTNSS
ncbi:hypothetical protein O0L34_g7072 [Tuta absoluta]|nr:hypothetical protein O0L34_g7072 [Tuta absoluta]